MTESDRNPATVGPKRAGVAWNAMANFGGQAVAFAVSLLVVPVYIALMGIEAYGLVGIYLVVQTLLRLLDLGLSPAVNRQMARYASHGRDHELWDFFRTFEVIFLALGAVSAMVFAAIVPWVASGWFETDLDPATVRSALWVMVGLCALQWPIGFYHGVMLGLERHGAFNAVRAIEAAATAGAAILVLTFVDDSVSMFFFVLLASAMVFVVIYRVTSVRCMPARVETPRFRRDMIRHVARFAGGMLAISATAIVLSQLDKVILSATVSLEKFGYYSLATVAAGVLIALVITPIFTAIFPRLSALAATDDEAGLARLYHASSQAMAALLAPPAITLALFAEPLLAVWTRDPVVAERTGPIVCLLAIGTFCNGLMNPPYALQLAAGWTRLPVMINLGLIVFTLPLLLVLVPEYGTTACASIWLGSMAGYVCIGVPLTHRRLLRGQTGTWFLRDVAPPTIAAGAVLGVAYLLLAPLPATWYAVFLIAAVAAVALAASVGAAPSARAWIRGLILRRSHGQSIVD